MPRKKIQTQPQQTSEVGMGKVVQLATMFASLPLPTRSLVLELADALGGKQYGNLQGGAPVQSNGEGGKAPYVPSVKQLAWWNRNKEKAAEGTPAAKYGEKLSVNGKPLGRPPLQKPTVAQPETPVLLPEVPQEEETPLVVAPAAVPEVMEPNADGTKLVKVPCTHSQVVERLLTLTANRIIICPECDADLHGLAPVVTAPKFPKVGTKGKRNVKEEIAVGLHRS